jgi:hypothetical protein
MLGLPPVPPVTGWEMSLRLPRDHYVRLDSNDYSVHPSAVGRRVLVRADLDRVRVWCEGGVVADHERVWAKHQTISGTECCSPPPASGSTSSPTPTTADGCRPNWPGSAAIHCS